MMLVFVAPPSSDHQILMLMLIGDADADHDFVKSDRDSQVKP